MVRRKLVKTLLALSLTVSAVSSYAATEVQFWHSMEGELGNEVNALVQRFNQTHPDYHVVPVYKGDYQQSLAAGISAVRAKHPPALLQVYEAGTATMMASKATKPVWQVFRDAGVSVDEQQFIPTILSYYSDGKSGHMLSEPFNSSTPVLYYNKDAFRRAGLNPDNPPKTWQQVATAAKALKQIGLGCGYTSGWQGWIQLEEFSTWHGLPIATQNNGFDGTDVNLLLNGPVQQRHIEQLAQMIKAGTFSYFGRTDQSTPKFYSGDCGLFTASSASLADIRHNAKFDFGVSTLPYDAEVPNAPQNAIIGGASLWVMQGQSAAVEKGAAEFLKYLSTPEVAAEWHQKTGYLPVTSAGYELTRKQGFYKQYPESEIAIRQMLNKPALPFTKGLRLGNLPQIRTIMDEELEGVWTGKLTAKQALDAIVKRGDQQLKRFHQQVK